ATRLLRVHAVDRVQPHQRVVLVAAVLPLARCPHHAGDRVTATQPVLADLRHRHVHVVRPGQVAAGADERVVVQHVQDPGHRDEHIVLTELRLALGGGGPLAAPAPTTVPVPVAPAAAAAALAVLVATTAVGPGGLGATAVAAPVAGTAGGLTRTAVAVGLGPAVRLGPAAAVGPAGAVGAAAVSPAGAVGPAGRFRSPAGPLRPRPVGAAVLSRRSDGGTSGLIVLRPGLRR